MKQDNPTKEEFDFEGCHACVYRANGKVVLWVEYSKPMSLIILAGFIHMFGEPTDYCTEDKDDSGFLFAFNDRKPELAQLWKDTFSKVPTTVWNGKVVPQEVTK